MQLFGCYLILFDKSWILNLEYKKDILLISSQKYF